MQTFPAPAIRPAFAVRGALPVLPVLLYSLCRRVRRFFRCGWLRRLATADRDLTFIDHEAAHGHDIVGTDVRFKPQHEFGIGLVFPDDILPRFPNSSVSVSSPSHPRSVIFRWDSTSAALLSAAFPSFCCVSASSNAPSQLPSSSIASIACSTTYASGTFTPSYCGRGVGSATGGTASSFVQTFEFRADRDGGFHVRLGARAIRGELILQHVLRGEERVDHVPAQNQFVIARAIQQRFEDVRRFRQRGETERRRAALDRMRRAEDRREVFGIGIGDVQHEEQLLHLREVFIGLVEEGLIELGNVECMSLLSDHPIHIHPIN